MEILLGRKRDNITNPVSLSKSKEQPQICQKCGNLTDVITIKNTGDLYVIFKREPFIHRHIPNFELFFSQYLLKNEKILCKKCIYQAFNNEENAKEEIIELFNLTKKDDKKEKGKIIISFGKKTLLNTHIEKDNNDTNNTNNKVNHSINNINHNKQVPFLVSKGFLNPSSTVIHIPKTESEGSELIDQNPKNVEIAKKALNDLKIQISNMHYCNQIQKNTLISLFYSLDFFKDQVKNQLYINEYNKEVLLNNLTEEQRRNLNLYK